MPRRNSGFFHEAKSPYPSVLSQAKKSPKRLQVTRPERQQRNILACVAVVMRSTSFACLPVCVGQGIRDFLDESVGWTLESTSDKGFVHLLDRLAAQEWTGVGPLFRSIRTYYAGIEAAKRGDLAVLKWLMDSYYQGLQLERKVFNTIFTLAVIRGNLDILQWLKQQRKLASSTEMDWDLRSSHPQVIAWMHTQRKAQYLSVEFNEAIAIEGNLEFLKWLHLRENYFKSVAGWS